MNRSLDVVRSAVDGACERLTSEATNLVESGEQMSLLSQIWTISFLLLLLGLPAFAEPERKQESGLSLDSIIAALKEAKGLITPEAKLDIKTKSGFDFDVDVKNLDKFAESLKTMAKAVEVFGTEFDLTGVTPIFRAFEKQGVTVAQLQAANLALNAALAERVRAKTIEANSCLGVEFTPLLKDNAQSKAIVWLDHETANPLEPLVRPITGHIEPGKGIPFTSLSPWLTPGAHTLYIFVGPFHSGDYQGVAHVKVRPDAACSGGGAEMPIGTYEFHHGDGVGPLRKIPINVRAK